MEEPGRLQSIGSQRFGHHRCHPEHSTQTSITELGNVLEDQGFPIPPPQVEDRNARVSGHEGPGFPVDSDIPMDSPGLLKATLLDNYCIIYCLHVVIHFSISCSPRITC